MGSDGNVQFSCISIHALREEGDGGVAAVFRSFACISIHALREEGDYNTEAIKLLLKEFLSTPSARRATLHGCLCRYNGFDFYPRPPRGGRPRVCRSVVAPQAISIHALREEGDPPSRRSDSQAGWNFYPRPPRGGRPGKAVMRTAGRPISIHALREEGDDIQTRKNSHHDNFYPRPPRGGRRV